MPSALRVLSVAVLCLALVASGCSYGQPRRDDVSVGEGLDMENLEDDSAPGTTAPSPDGPADPPAPPPEGAPATPAPARPRGPANQGTSAHPAGWKLTLTVDGQLTYKRSEDILLQLVARNDGREPLQYDPNDLRHFAIIPAGGAKGRTWYDTDCRPRPADVTGGAITLEPGEEATFQTTYPGPGVDGSNEPCRLDPGDYDVGGLIAWCPPGTVRSDGTCDPRRRDVIASGAVRIKIVP
ncbi:MAG: hypothetical protein KY395_01245 [Actinobacteria bacterium]|nr:hypothetical protein [Actinomycetota bacterium]